ncbi:hypothetical protein BDZ89DRAFT_1140203 [Hymenopellis radicata]|nr:hypothetical protein BDZ89DRAFT_1140203 [Hymenopellis radicata]
MPVKERAPGAYVRVATAEDMPGINDVAARAFEKDPLLCWLAGLEQPIEQCTPEEQKSCRKYLHLMERAEIRSVFLSHGRITVVAIPDGKGGESIAAYTLWLPPGCSTDSLATTVRAGFLHALPGWGLRGFYRAVRTYKPAVVSRSDREIVARGYNLKTDFWRLEQAGTDPDHEGRGYCGMLIDEAVRNAPNNPIILEATAVRCHSIYEHYGWQDYDCLTFGTGTCDAQGVKKTGESATGFPTWMMMKFPPDQ